MKKTLRVLGIFGCALLALNAAWAQKDKTLAPPVTAPDADFLQAADDVLADMSKILSLPVLQPLKKSVRSRDEIRAFLIKNMNEDKDASKRYADQRALEAFGLIPKGYPLDQKLLALLTEQIAGLYDPKGREFFIADWTSVDEQRVIMAHELTHALQDQHFHVEKWEDAAKPNDDGVMARDAVLEGSATIAMIDYLLRDSGKTSRDIPGIDPALLIGNAADSPELSSAPLIVQDEMLFPYLSGATFTQAVLKAWNGWPDLHKLFDNPPASTQQIMHPDLYLRGVMPQVVSLAPVEKVVPHGWKKLDENLVGEFALHVIFKQFIGGDRADVLSPMWAGDKYAIYEQKTGGPTLLIVRMRLTDAAAAARFFGGYSQVLEMKHDARTNLLRRPNFFSFDTPDGGVYLRCTGPECLIAEGATRDVFDAMTRAIGWADGPADAGSPKRDDGSIVRSPPRNNPGVLLAIR
jgi:hypothetical protein